MKRLLTLLQAGALGACLLLPGCGGEPYAYQSGNELQPGPGLLSGEDGVFTVYGLSPEEREALRRQEAGKRAEDSPSPTSSPAPDRH